MSELKSQLLDLLPASERNLFQDNLKEAMPRAVSVERVLGVEALKNALRCAAVHSFKHDRRSDRLYVYYNGTAARDRAATLIKNEPAKVGNLITQNSGPNSLRIDGVSKYSAVVQTVNGKTETFDDYVRRSKALFAQTHDGRDVQVVFRVDNERKIVYASATSSRLRSADFEMSRRLLATRSNSVRDNKASGYQASAAFHYADHCARSVPKVVEVDTQAVEEPATNALLEGLKTTMAPTEPLVYFAGRFPQEVIDQITRIVAGERLPAEPAIAIYDDLSAVGKTQGTAVALHYKNGKRVDIEAILASLRLSGKSAAVYPTEIAKAILPRTDAVIDPSVIIMRDHGDEDKAYLVLNTTKGFHRHVELKKRK